MDEIIELAKQIGAKLKDSQEYKNFLVAQDKYEKNDELQDLIGDFNLKKMALMNEADKGDDKNEAEMEKLQTEMKAAYTKATEHPVMKEYYEAKGNFETSVQNVFSVIQYSITGEVPSGCTGNCSSCGGCH